MIKGTDSEFDASSWINKVLTIVTDLVIKASAFSQAVVVLALMALGAYATFVLLRRSGPRAVMVSHAADMEDFAASGAKRLVEDLRYVSDRYSNTMGVAVAESVQVLRPLLTTLTADDVVFYVAFYDLVHAPDDFWVSRDATVVPVLAPASVRSRLCPKGAVDDARLRAWIDKQGRDVDRLSKAIAMAVSKLGGDAPSADPEAARVAWRLMRCDLFLNRYMPEMVHAYNMRKSSGGKVQFAMLRMVLGDAWKRTIYEVRNAWNIPKAWSRSGKSAASIWSVYSSPRVQKIMLGLPDQLSKTAGNPNRTFVVA